MFIKKSHFIISALSSSLFLSGCASSSFKEYFNEPVVAPVVEKSINGKKQTQSHYINQKDNDNKENRVETFEVK